jgi:hypothetical protein
MQTVIKSYCDEPVPVPLTLSLHNVTRGREQEGNGVEHMNNVGHQPHHHLMPKQNSRGATTVRGGPQGSIGAYSESNLLALGSQQHRYNPQYHMQHRNAFLYGRMGEYIYMSILYLWSSGTVLGYRSGGPGSISGTTRKTKVVGLEQGPLSLVSTTEELLDRKVAAPV